MPLAIPGRVVVFDYGEVISRSPSEEDRRRILAAAGVPADDLWRAYAEGRGALDAGLTPVTEYWARIGRSCGVEWDLPTIQLLWTLDVRGWTVPEPGVVGVLADLAAGGTRLALLSNASADYGSGMRFSPVGALFERVFVSGELLLLKPDPAIFRYVAEALATPPEDLVFVDNRAENVAGAESVGITGHVFTGADRLRTFLERIAAEAAS